MRRFGELTKSTNFQQSNTTAGKGSYDRAIDHGGICANESYDLYKVTDTGTSTKQSDSCRLPCNLLSACTLES